MKTDDIFLSVFIILIFIGIMLFNVISVGIKQIQDNWPEYRCNPMVMPFAGYFGHDAGENFTYCIQNMQSDYMNYLLTPVNYLMSVSGNISENLTGAVQGIREFINQIRNLLTSVIQSIFGVFLNILVAFQELMIKMKDMVGKIVGIMASMMYILEGSVMTANSTWRGPPGDMLRTIGKIA